MVSQVTLDTSALQDYARFLKQAPEIAREEMTGAVAEALALLEREVKENTPVGAHGLLRSSIATQMLGSAIAGGLGVAGKVFSVLSYALPVELGTKPHFPPVAPLRDWVEKKLGVPPSQSESVAFLIARKISTRGTKGAQMFERTLDANAGQVNAVIARAVARIGARLQAGER